MVKECIGVTCHQRAEAVVTLTIEGWEERMVRLVLHPVEAVAHHSLGEADSPEAVEVEYANYR